VAGEDNDGVNVYRWTQPLNLGIAAPHEI